MLRVYKSILFATCIGLASVVLPKIASAEKMYEACDAGERVVRFSHVVSATGHPKGDAASTFADRVNRAMDGRLCMVVFPNSMLYDDSQVIAALNDGRVEIAAPSLSKLNRVTSAYRVFDRPFTFDSLDSLERFASGSAGQDLLGTMEREGHVGLGYLLSGMKQFTADRPLVWPGTAQGRTFRVQSSETLAAMVEGIGATPRMLPFREVYGALMRGDVDGQENSWCNIATQRFFEVQDSVTRTNHGVLVYLLMTSRDFLDSLEPHDRRQFEAIARRTIEDANAEAAAKEARCEAVIAAEGVTIHELDASARAAWLRAMAPVHEKLDEEIGDALVRAALASNGAS